MNDDIYKCASCCHWCPHPFPCTPTAAERSEELECALGFGVSGVRRGRLGRCAGRYISRTQKAFAALVLSCAITAAVFAVTPPNDVEHNACRQQEFVAFNPRYKEMKAERAAAVRALAEEVERREAAREPTACSHQILFELKLMMYFSADFTAIDRRIHDLQTTLDHPEREALAEKQDPEDGHWGACYEGWPLKLSATYDHRNYPTARSIRFFDRVNSPEKLTAYLVSFETSDIAKTGIDHAFDLNESLSDLMRLILRGEPEGYPWDPRLKQTMMDLLMHRFRNPDTGWWGEKYVRQGRFKFVDDLSMTFHTVSYLDGKVPDLAKIIDTALALETVDTPAGWLWDGSYWNHNNMDVAVLFRFGWPQASEAQRQAMRAKIERMLRWCLAESLQPDGSFKPLVPDASLEEADYFGAAFLARIGYFDPARRFWTDAAFPDSDAVRRRIVRSINSHIATGGAGSFYYRSILEELR